MARTVASLAAELREREMSLTGRVAWLTWQFFNGQTFTVADVMTVMGLSESGAQRLLCKISQGAPIFCCDGRWQICS